LEVFEDRSHSFTTIRQRFQVFHRMDFPHELNPFRLAHDALHSEALAIPTLHRGLLATVVNLAEKEGCPASLMIRVPLLESITDTPAGDQLAQVLAQCARFGLDLENLVFSPSAPVNLDSHSRHVAGIPEEARFFAVCHGAAFQDGSLPDCVRVKEMYENVERSSEHLFELVTSGGFAYFDAAGHFLSVNVFSQTMYISRCGTINVQFGESEPVTKLFKREISQAGRWIPTTLPAITNGGAQYYAWVLPEELGTCPFGGFVYRMPPGKPNLLFPVVSSF
jgi:hypothetical protein